MVKVIDTEIVPIGPETDYVSYTKGFGVEVCVQVGPYGGYLMIPFISRTEAAEAVENLSLMLDQRDSQP